MSDHEHTTYVDGCFACEVDADEELTAAGWERDDVQEDDE